MKITVTLLLTCLLTITSITAQKKVIVTSILTQSQINEVITQSVKEDNNITMPIFRVYKIVYTTEPEYLVLCESQDEIKNKKDTINKNIHAILFLKGGSGLEKEWEIKDNIVQSATEETCIWFWTKFINFQDYDQDGHVDYTLIYGTKGMNGFSDGRMKIAMINLLGEKIFIRHQNGVGDYERITKVDKAYYALPKVWQMAVRKKMQLMEKDNKTIIAPDWEKQMQQQKVTLQQK